MSAYRGQPKKRRPRAYDLQMWLEDHVDMSTWHSPRRVPPAQRFWNDVATGSASASTALACAASLPCSIPEGQSTRARTCRATSRRTKS